MQMQTIVVEHGIIIKPLIMTVPKGNSEFCLFETFNIPWSGAKGNIEVEGNKTDCFQRDQSLRVLLYLPTQQLEKTRKKLLAHKFAAVQGARPDHVRVESSCSCFPRELLIFVRPRELESFDPWHMTPSAPIRKCIWVGRYNNGS